MNPRRPVVRHLSREELERLGVVLDTRRTEHPWPVAALRLLTPTGAVARKAMRTPLSERKALSASVSRTNSFRLPYELAVPPRLDYC